MRFCESGGDATAQHNDLGEGLQRPRAPPTRARKQSDKLPDFDERWVPWEELMHLVFGRDVVLHTRSLPGLSQLDLAHRQTLLEFLSTSERK